MPRRKLNRYIRTAPPSEEAARKYLLHLNPKQLYHTPELFPSLASPHLFGDNRPLQLEVGCGCGDFLCQLAREEPMGNFVGVDISWKPLYKAVENAVANRLDNIKFIKADFKLMYPLLKPNSLQAVYFHFPDPNLKEKYRRRRIFSPAFISAVHRALVPGGRLSIMTDVIELFVAMLLPLEGDGRFKKTHAERYLIGFEIDNKSRFQRLWERHDLPTLRFEVAKQEL